MTPHVYVWWLHDGVWQHYRTETLYAASEVEGVLRIIGYQHIQIKIGTPA